MRSPRFEHAPPLSGQDAGYLHRERDGQPMHFIFFGRLQPPSTDQVSVASVRAQVAARIDRVPMLRRKVLVPPFGIGPMRWVDDPDFDLAQHICAWPEAAGTPEHEAMARLTEQQLRRDRPLWQMRLSPPRPDGSVLFAFASHHCLMDGGLAREVLHELFAETDGRDDAPSSWVPVPAPGGARLLASGLGGAVLHRLRGRRAGASSHESAVAAAAPSVPDAEDGGLSGHVQPGRTIRLLELPLDDLRHLRRRTGATINDLYLAAVTAGLRGLLHQRGARLDRRVIALVPRDVRTDDEARAVGNRTWSMFVPLPLGAADADERLQEVRAATAHAKGADRPAGTAQFRFDVAVSNVVLTGSHVVGGASLEHYHATAPLQGENRLAAVALSYEDTFTVTFTADAEAFPDLDVLAEATRAGFQELFAAVPERRT